MNNIFIDTERKTAAKGGLRVPLSTIEFELLETLLRNQGSILNSAQLADGTMCSSAESVRQRLRSLRRKLSFIGADDLIKTLSNMGYTVADNFCFTMKGAF